MPPSSGELWGHHLMPHTIIVDCLLPSGIIIQMDCMREATLENIKANLWQEAKKYPLFHLLAEPSCYIFVSITQDAELEEFYDESRRLCDLHLFQPILKIIEPVGNREEKMLNYEIGITIGMAIHEFEGMKDREVHDFRRKILTVCRDAVDKRNSSSEYEQILYMFPPEVEQNSILSPCVEKKLDKGFIDVDVWLLSPNNEKQKYSVKVAKSDSPETIIAEAILQKVKSPLYSKEQQQLCVIEHQDRYLLKVCGTDEYLLQQYPIWQYKYIRTCIAKSHRPQLMLMSKEGVLQSIPRISFHMPSFMRRTIPSVPSKQTLLLWQVNEILRIQILWATYVNVKEVDKIYVKTGIFHGTESLCSTRDTKHVVFSNPKWNEWLEYDMYIPDVPRSAKLCFSICSLSRKKRREEHCALAWGNVNLFDYKSQFHTDRLSLHLWPFPKGMNDLLNPLGNAGSNPNKDSPCLEIEFDRYFHPVIFPTYSQISEYVQFTSKMHDNTSGKPDPPSGDLISETDLSLLYEISRRDPLSEISEQEKELLWKLQKHCVAIPDLLPKLLDAVKWNSRDEVAQLYELLKDWPDISPETALELLDCKYPDQAVRKFAVKCLDKTLTDDKLSQYILQLVQVLKYEPYLDNELARFLLKRSLLNRKIGHFFFWHLRSEMTDAAVAVKFGLLLEAYCRSIGDQLRLLTRQVEALEKLTKLTDSLKQRKDDTHKDRMRYFFDQIQQTDYLETLQNFPSPLNNCQILGNLLVDECKILDSAKRPLWLSWSNPDPMAELFFGMNAIIYKNGDDLRQDMLTLQVIHIIDNIWRNEGLDLRMMPYACLATGKQVGMIEVVYNAKTVMGIQRTGGKMAAFQVDCTQLHKWIKEKNKDDRYEQAIETFTHSCAGYCVATFILGIGDRNPDNIMVNEEGQIFHIDFGHFLGHFKKKFGINRERVPFVLTDDFLYVISKGTENPKKSKEFQAFQELCGKAYLMLRHHANLLISLFTMMLGTGIPELQSIDDIGYLRKTLAVEKMDEEALEYFQNQFFEAYGGAWTTKLDWFFHSVKHM